VEKLKELNIQPGPIYKDIKEGKLTTLPSGQLTKDFVSPPIPGRKIVLLGDTNDPSSIIQDGANCDVLVHEATFGGEEENQAIQYGHSTAKMAGKFAQRIGTKHLVLTHFSSRMDDSGIKQLVAEAAENYNGPITAATDFMEVNIPRKNSGQNF